MYESLIRPQRYPVILNLRISNETHEKLIVEAKKRGLDWITLTGKDRSGYQTAARQIIDEYFKKQVD